MSNIKVSGSASGTGEITIAAPVTNSSRTQTLPDATGTVLLDSAATVSGNLAFTGTGNRITGDFTNGSRPNRVMFQTSTADSPTRLGAIPSGTGTVSEFSLYNTSDPSNASTGQLLLNATEFRIANAITGTGTYVPMTFYNNGSEQMRLTTAGNFGIGTSTPAGKVDIVGLVNNYALRVTDGTRSGGLIPSSTGGIALYTPDTTPLSFWTNNTERARIDSSGNLGLGVTPSAWVTQPAIQQLGGALWGVNAANYEILQNAFYNGTNYIYRNTNLASRYNQNAGVHSWFTAPSGTAGNTISFTQAMTLDASGRLGIGTTSPASAYRMSLTGDGSTMVGGLALTSGGNAAYIGQIGATSADCEYWNAANGYVRIGTNNTERARITSGGDLLVGTTSNNLAANVGIKFLTSTTAPQIGVVVSAASNNYTLYNTTAGAYRFYVTDGGTINATNTTISAISDQRLKENVQDLEAGLDKIMALKPRKFDWKAGKGKDIKGDRGFIAQEFEQVFPDLIDTWADPAPEGEEPYKAVRADLIPVLVKAIQELNAKVESLTTELNALKGT